MVALIDSISHIRLKAVKTIIVVIIIIIVTHILLSFIECLFYVFTFYLSRSLPMGTKSVVDLMESSSEVHFSGVYMDGIEQRNAGAEQPTTSATDMNKQPFVIGVFFHDKLPTYAVIKSYICLFVSWKSMWVLLTLTLSFLLDLI